MIHFNGPTTVHTVVEGDLRDVTVHVPAPDVAAALARIAELEAQTAELAAYCQRGGGDWHVTTPGFDDGLHAAYHDVARWLMARGLAPDGR